MDDQPHSHKYLTLRGHFPPKFIFTASHHVTLCSNLSRNSEVNQIQRERRHVTMKKQSKAEMQPNTFLLTFIYVIHVM